MSHGTALPLVRQWLITELQARTGSGQALEGVRVLYSQPAKASDITADNGRAEAIYNEDANTSFEVIGFRNTVNVKYREIGRTELIITVAGNRESDTQDVVDSRAADFLGEVINVLASSQPAPSSPIERIVVTAADVELQSGEYSIAGATWSYGVKITVNVRLEADIHL